MVTISLALLLTITACVVIRTGRSTLPAAATCVLLGFTLASTALSPALAALLNAARTAIAGL